MTVSFIVITTDEEIAPRFFCLKIRDFRICYTNISHFADNAICKYRKEDFYIYGQFIILGA